MVINETSEPNGDEMTQEKNGDDSGDEPTNRQVLDAVVTLSGEVRTIKANVTLLSEQHRSFADATETRFRSNSMRARSESQTNLDQDGAIAQIKTQLDEVSKKTDVQTAMLSKAAGLLKDPKVLLIGAIIYSIAQHWAEKHGLL